MHQDKNTLISPCDGKLLAYENINLDDIVQVKGLTYSLKDLVKDNEIFELYHGGTCLIFRLCPTDYHRFHLLMMGYVAIQLKIDGHYYSWNPIALKGILEAICENKENGVYFTQIIFSVTLCRSWC